MRPNQSSATAEHNATLRLHESMRPGDERVCDDPCAALFLPDRIFYASDRKKLIEQTVADWEAHFPGVCNAIIARTRFIDECLEEAVSGGIRQLVILGAGYDTRAMQFEDLKKTVTVFELDHPSTQKKKLERIEKHDNADLSHVRYICIDFAKEDLGNKLLASGYDEKLKRCSSGKALTKNLTKADFFNAYFQGVNQHRNVSEMFIFLQAMVS